MMRSSYAVASRKAVSALTGLLLVLGTSLVFALGSTSVAHADTAPPVTTPATPATVSADALPTVQINGVVWAQVTVGNTVYATGNFTSARPAGSPAGTNETPRAYLLAYDLTTGNLITTFNHTLNAQGRALAVSPDGTKLYVGGNFTQVDGVNHYRIAEFNLAAGGALVAGFSPTPNSVVQALTASNTTVYAGGTFTAVGSVTRTRLAAFSSAGALLSWAPTADDYPVAAMVLTPDGSKVIVGGSFTTLNMQPSSGLGALNATTGANMPWAAVGVIKDGNNSAGITSLTTDGTQIYGTGYVFTADSPTSGYLEGGFGLNASTGAIDFLEDCHGDTYGGFGVGQVFYVVSHEHYCGNIGSFPETPTRSYHRATAFTNYATGTVQHNAEGNYMDWYGQPAPTQLNWYPTLTAGTFTGQDQAAWSITGNSQYIALGGEFPSVNGVAQQGLVRFAVSSIAPNKVGPTYSTNITPIAQSLTSGTVKVNWTQTADPDNTTLTYKLVRTSGGVSKTVYTTTVNDNFYTEQQMSFTDTGLTPGSTASYRVYVYDPFGNFTSSLAGSATVSSYAPSAYSNDVINQGATDYWRLGETSGSTATDWTGNSPLTEQAGVTHGAAGAIIGDTDGASTFDGSSTDGGASTTTAVAGPQTFSVETWFNTTSTSGGKLIGFGNATTGLSSGYDRHIYMDNAGHLSFGVCGNLCPVTLTTSGTYNDGQWHQVVGTLSSAGMTLYVDGRKVGSYSGSGITAQVLSGYWRLGGDNLAGWNANATSNYFAGSLDEAAVFPTALTLAQIQQQYTDSGRSTGSAPAPTDAYGKAVSALNPDMYLRLNETSGTTAVDTSANQANASYQGGVTLGVSSPVSGATGSAVTLDGSSGVIVGQQQIVAPTVYSEDAWFKTTTTSGGKIMGFGDASSGESSNYDRHVIMLNTGQLMFGTYTGQVNEAVTPKSYNDGAWHNVVATQGPDGMTLYVDGRAVATNPQTQAQSYTGYWRVGGDHTWGGTSSDFFAGSVDEASFYNSTELTAAQVLSQYDASPAAVNTAPTASFTSTPTNLSVAFDGSASADPDGTVTGYSWNYGDGSAAGTGVKPSHTYAAAGTYPVTLTVTDNQGATNAVTAKVTVTAPANVAPVAAFTSTPTNLSVAFDGTGSADPDGTVASYAWDFGDGGSAATASPTHAYTAAGTYTVRLTVTDNSGATNSVSHSVTVSAAAATNKPPVAAFTATPTNLSVAFDGSGSSDPDGTVAGYSWNYGDGSPAGTGVSPSHTYAAAGTYSVTLTVTDNSGATTAITHSVTVAVAVANKPPVAAFTSTPTNLSVAFDGTGSADPDGTIAGYSWNFGDGSAVGTGATPSHTYSAAGTYPVTLTVTDNSGATTSITHSVTVTPPANAPAPVLASDAFSRTVTGGLGTADTGGAWKVVGTAANASVSGGNAMLAMPTATTQIGAYLPSVSSTDTDTMVTYTTDKAATGGGVYLYVVGRRVGTNMEYRGRIRISGSTVYEALTELNNSSSETVVKAETAVAGLTYTPGTMLDARLQVTGTSPTTLRLKVWAASGTEPSAWQLTTTDSASALQAAGAVGLTSYLSGSATNAPVTTKAANFAVHTTAAPPVAAFTASCTARTCSTDASTSADPNNDIAGYTWSWGDGTVTTGLTSSHTFAAPGTYQITLTATDQTSRTSVATQTVTIS